jgi:membrane associated rhomboid family serine protease
MIPLRDTVKSRNTPIFTWIIIIVNIFVFIHEIRLPGQSLVNFINTFGLTPSKINFSQPVSLYPLVSHMFLHGSWIHLISNMWIFFIFGDNVEDKIGGIKFVVFYLIGGISAGLVQSIFGDPTVAVVGASGAIAAVLGAYFLFYPTARVLTLIPIFIFPWFIRIPAIIYLGLWFILQLFQGLLSMDISNSSAAGGVAWWAHIGGFLIGFFMAIPTVITNQKDKTFQNNLS